jgi:ubiquinone biosynthesis protein
MYQLIEISKPYKLKIQPQFLMLQKTLFYVEALGRKLHPKLNVWQACEPFVADFIKERYSIKLALQNFKQEWPRILEITPKIPHLIEKSLHGEKPEHLITKPLLIGVIIGIIIAKHLH